MNTSKPFAMLIVPTAEAVVQVGAGDAQRQRHAVPVGDAILMR
ncbi:hypothetical protein ACWD0Z_30745 [Streptomyces sp. NPDC003007]